MECIFVDLGTVAMGATGLEGGAEEYLAEAARGRALKRARRWGVDGFSVVDTI